VTATGERLAPVREGAGHRVRSSSRVSRPGRHDRQRRLTGLVVTAYYATLAVVSTLLAMASLGMYNRPLDVPIVYNGDAISGGAQIKGTLENGWYEHNPSLGAPFGQNMHDFPMADHTQFVLARLFGLFVDEWSSVYNLCFLATFPLTALAAAWFARVLGVSRPSAFVLGLLFAFTPYHFIHGQPHLALSMLFVVPLFSALVLKALADRALWGQRAGGAWWNPLSWATPATFGVLAILVLTGSTSSYYAVFGLILMSVAVVVLLFRRKVRRAVGAAVAMLGLIFVMLVNMAPDMLYARSLPASPAAFARLPVESEVYTLKLAPLLFPAPWHRIDAFSRFRMHYEGTFPNTGESPTLGIIAALGFVYLLALPFLVMLRRQSIRDDGPLGQTQQHLSLLTLVAFLFGTTGGLGTLFALFVSPDIRGWARIVVYLALFGLAAMALHFDAGVRWLSKRAEGRREKRDSGSTSFRRAPSLLGPMEARAVAIAAVTAIGVGSIGLLDEVAPPSWTSNNDAAIDAWNNDAAYVSQIEAKVPSGTSVFELPSMQYPESPPISDMNDYDPLRPYLHSTDLKWSYGGVKGRPRADWQLGLGGLSPSRLVVALGASGFGGIHLDRFGFPNHDTGELEQDLSHLLGKPIVSPDGRFAFYDMTEFNQRLEQSYSTSELASIRRHTVRQPVFYWQPGFTGPLTPDGNGHMVLVGRSASPTAIVDNPGGPIPMKLVFTVTAVGATEFPRDVDITWPDGQHETVQLPDAQGVEVTHSFTAQPGQATLALRGEGMTTINLLDLVLRDPGLHFELRGRAGELAAEQRVESTSERNESAPGTPVEHR